jgi:hypothetical protein
VVVSEFETRWVQEVAPVCKNAERREHFPGFVSSVAVIVSGLEDTHMLRLLPILLLSAVALWGDSFPTYSYFYSCDSGLVDCAAFPRHHNGDFGMSGLQYISPTSAFDGLAEITISESNTRGEVIGSAFFANAPVAYSAPIYGFAGNLFCFGGAGCTDSLIHPIDINNSGLSLWSFDGIPSLASASNVVPLDIHLDGVKVSPSIGFMLLGINDSDQLLAVLPGRGEGVLSPFEIPAVPEPSSVFLLVTVGTAALWNQLTKRL